MNQFYFTKEVKLISGLKLLRILYSFWVLRTLLVCPSPMFLISAAAMIATGRSSHGAVTCATSLLLGHKYLFFSFSKYSCNYKWPAISKQNIQQFQLNSL